MKEVTRQQLTPQDKPTDSSNPQPSPNLQVEIVRLTTALHQATQARIEVMEDLQKMRQLLEYNIQLRNDAWFREDLCHTQIQEQEQYINQMEVQNQELQLEVNRLTELMNPNYQPQEVQDDPGVVMTPEQEE